MIKILKRNIISFFISLWAVTTISFIFMHSLPGSPFLCENGLSDDIAGVLSKQYGLEDSIWVQYGRFLTQIINFDLGSSIIYNGRTVSNVIAETFPATLFIGSCAFTISCVLGTIFGVLLVSGSFASKWLIGVYLNLIFSFPSFVISTLLQHFFCARWNLFPSYYSDSSGWFLPALCLSLFPTVYITRLIKSGLQEVLVQDYILSARARGFSNFHVIYRHALKNILLPILAYIGPVFTSVLSGCIVVEKIFGVPGLGAWLIMSIQARDYPMILGITIFFSSLFIAIMIAIDSIRYLLDPRLE